MSFLKSLFGLKSAPAEESAADAGPCLDYKGFVIRATPHKSQGQFQTAGVIEKEVDGALRQHKFLRADRHTSLEDANAFSLLKGRQIVDEQGERMFARSDPDPA